MQFSKLVFNDPAQARGSCIAIIGGGGKTTLLHRLGSEFVQCFDKVLITSLTKSAANLNHIPVLSKDLRNENIEHLFQQYNPLFIMRSKINQYKITGIAETELKRFFYQSDLTVFECDGARKRPLKAHTERDPQVPDFASHAIIVVGAEVVDYTLASGLVHRPELFQSMWNIPKDFILNAEFIAEVVTSKKGYLNKIPDSCQRIYFVNKANTAPQQAERLVQAISERSGSPIFFGSLHTGQLMEFYT